jgi:hypothetical protein
MRSSYVTHTAHELSLKAKAMHVSIDRQHLLLSQHGLCEGALGQDT